MSSTQYIYAGTRAATLTEQLLSETQLERLLSAKSGQEARQVLQDTFLAPYLSGKDAKPVSLAVEEHVANAKKILAAIAPDERVLAVLWLRYDFYNLRTVAKGVRQELSAEEIVAKCYLTGTVEPAALVKGYQENSLVRFSAELANAADTMKQAEQVFMIDMAADEFYFRALRRLASDIGDPFVERYVTLHIDLFNIRAGLRMGRLGDLVQKRVFVQGGTVSSRDLETEQQALDALIRIGGEKIWEEAVRQYRETGSFVLLDKVAQEYVLQFLKEESIAVFSPAPLYAYFSATKNNAQVIRAVVVAKDAGIPEAELRLVLRRLYR